VTAVLLWLQTSLSGAFRRRITSALFVTVEIDSPALVACVRQWATQQAQQQHARRPGRMQVLSVFVSRAFMRRVMRAAGDALRAGRTITYLGQNLIVYTASGRIAASDCLSYVVLQPADESAAGGADSGADCCAWVKPAAGRRSSALGRASRAVWVHARQEGGAPGVGLLTGAPEPLLKMLENSGLRELMAPKPARGASGSGGGGGRDGDSGPSSVFVSVLRWHGVSLVHAALEAAYTQQKADDAGTFKLRTVIFRPKEQDRYSGYSGRSSGGDGGAAKPEWSRERERISRPMRTVVLPAEAAGVRRTAQRFMSAQYRAFCRVKGLPHRCGFALWGPPGCGKSSFVAALAAELGATLHILTLDAKRMTNGSVRELLGKVRGTCSIILIEDVDRALPEALMEPSASALSADAEESADSNAASAKENKRSSGKRGGRRGGDDDDDDDDETGDEPLSLEGLLDALAGAGASEGRLLFLTTNHINKLPRALLRPGIVDRTVEFTLGSVRMVRTLFTNFYLLQEEGLADLDAMAPRASENGDDDDVSNGDDLDQGGECCAGSTRLRLADATPAGVPAATVRSLAAEFAARCGECKYGLADVQGHLLDWRESPQEALDNIWRLFEHERLSLSRTTSRSSTTGGLAPAVSFAPASSLAPAASSGGTRRPSGPIRPSAQLDDTSTAEVLRRQRRSPLDAPGAVVGGGDGAHGDDDDSRAAAAAAGGDEAVHAEEVAHLLRLLDDVAAVHRGGGGGSKPSGRSWAVARSALALRRRGVGSAPPAEPSSGSGPAAVMARTASARPADAAEMRAAAMELAAGGGPLRAAMSSAV
jgi:hypothetical protein